MTTPDLDAVVLPALPQDFMELHREWSPHVYAERRAQMQAYATAAVLADRERRALVGAAQTDAQLMMQALRANAGRKVTPEEAFEQRVSFVFSMQNGMTKDQVREALRNAYGVPVAARTQGDKS